MNYGCTSGTEEEIGSRTSAQKFKEAIRPDTTFTVCRYELSAEIVTFYSCFAARRSSTSVEIGIGIAAGVIRFTRKVPTRIVPRAQAREARVRRSGFRRLPQSGWQANLGANYEKRGSKRPPYKSRDEGSFCFSNPLVLLFSLLKSSSASLLQRSAVRILQPGGLNRQFGQSQKSLSN